MKKIIISFFMMVSISTFNYGQIDSLFLGQTPPGNTRKLFELSASAGNMASERITISPDGKEIYYEETNFNGIFKIKYYKYFNNKWNGPLDLFDDYYCIVSSPDGNSLFLENTDYSYCWISERQDTSWSQPYRFLKSINVHSLNITDSGNMYVSSSPEEGLGNLDISQVIINSSDTSIQGLGLPLNSSSNEGDFIVSRDESFIIVMSTRAGTLGMEDLFISFRKSDNTWTNPKNMGPTINTANSEFGPYVTDDNKYLFFSSGYTSPSSIYWVKVDELIDSLKNSNYKPYVRNNIPDQTDSIGNPFVYAIPNSIFFDDDGNETLTISAKLANNKDLPDWITYNPDTRIFAGTPTASAYLSIKVTAIDTAGESISDIFAIRIEGTTDILETDIKDRLLVYSNPNHDKIFFDHGQLSVNSYFQLIDIYGRTVHQGLLNGNSIDISSIDKGHYILKLLIKDEVISRKILIN